MRLISRFVYPCLLTTALLTAWPAKATLIAYTDPLGWAAASSGLTTIGFEGIAPANGAKDYSTSTGLTLNGVKFVGFEGTALYDLQVVDGNIAAPFYNFGSGATLKGPSYNSPATGFVPYFHIILPVNVTALGVDLMTVSPNALTYEVSLPGGTYTVATANRPTRTFFGLTSDAPIPYVDLAVMGTTHNGGTYGLIDNVQFGAEAQTAEASTLVLIGTGLVVFRWLRKPRLAKKAVLKLAPRPASA